MVKDSQIVNTKDIQRVLSIAKKNWWIVVLFVLLGVAVGYVYYYKQSNIFGAKCQILLKSNDQYSQGSVISDLGSTGNAMLRTYVDNSNEKRVIMSYDLIKQAIERLNFKVSYYLVGRLRTEEVFQGVPIRIEVNSLNNELYESMMGFKFVDEQTWEMTYTRGGLEKRIRGHFGKEFINTDMDILISKSTSIRGVTQASYMLQVHRIQTLVARFQGALSVDNPEYTNILELTVRDEIGQRGAMFLDTLAQVYIENSLQSRIDINKNTLFFIERQLGEVTDILNNIEDTLLDFKKENHIIDLQKEGNEYFGQYINFDNQKRSLELQIEALNDLEDYIIEDKDPQFLPPSIFVVSQDNFLLKSVGELYNLQLDLNQVSVTATKANFEVQQKLKRVEMLKQDMLVYINNDRSAIRDRIKSVNEQISSSLATIQEIPEKQRGLTNISRKLKVNEDMYLFLLQRRANTVIARAGIVPDTKVIEKARVTGLISPKKSMILNMGGGIGLVIALLVVFIRLLFFDRIESYEELKAATTLPIVGEIVMTKTTEELKVAVEHEPKSPLAEAFRTLRTNLQYLAAEVPEGSGTMIVITSFNPGEGKTFCSINLAAMLAKTGKKVLLLELDLHKPRVQKGLGITSEKGISTFAIGKDNIEDVVIHTHIENLDVILSGVLPPNPSELILSAKMKELFDYGRSHYDYVVVDTPPVGLLSDALVLMKAGDINLFVINIKFAYRHILKQIHELVEFHNLRHFGFLLNGVKRKKSRYYYNRYGYGYRYGSYGSYGGYGSYGSYGGYGDSGTNTKKK